jgi:ATP adenylyltransferase
MTLEGLVDVIENKMKMSHVYQPLLIKSLIEAGGTTTVRQLATEQLRQGKKVKYYIDSEEYEYEDET